VSLEQLIAEAVAGELERRGFVARASEPQAEVEPWRLLTLDEAAERLSRSPRWVRQRKETIGYVRLDGGALGFRLEDLQAFAADRVVSLADRSESSGNGRSLRSVP
jgi:hypothetical protein